MGALTGGEGSVISSPALEGLGLLPSVFQSSIEILRLMLTPAPAFRAAQGIILRNVQFSCLSAYQLFSGECLNPVCCPQG